MNDKWKRRTRRPSGVILVVAGAGLVVLAVAKQLRPEYAPPARASASTCDPSAAGWDDPYPKARWRLAPYLLGDTSVRLSHLVIAHAHSRRDSVLDPMGTELRESGRSEDEARALAGKLAAELCREPEGFARFAREFSDHTATAAWGGSLGLRPATQVPPRYLDALSTLEQGQVSRPIATPEGFHIVRLESDVVEQYLSADHIVIGYDSALALSYRANRKALTRTRPEARELAQKVLQELRAKPDNFERLVAKYSDAEDAVRDGYMGVFSTRKPQQPLLAEVLARAPVGGIIGPVSTAAGFQILRRREPRLERGLAASVIRIPYDDRSVGGVPKREAAVLAAGALEAARHSSERWRELQLAHCCEEPLLWPGGAAPVGLDTALASAEIGSVVPAPIDAAGAFWIFRRLDPSVVPRALPSLVLPEPERVDLYALVGSMNGQGLVAATEQLAAAVRPLDYLGSNGQAVVATVEDLARQFESAPRTERRALLERAMARLDGVLGTSRRTQLMTFIEDWTARQLMSP